MNKRYAGSRNYKCKGFGVLGWLLTIPVAIVVLLLLVFSFYEMRKAYWDSKVTEMREKDGGVKVSEKVSISAELYDKLPKVSDSPSIGSEINSKSVEPVFAVDREIVLKDGGPRVTRWERSVKRRSDGKVIGMIVTYHRVGGDFLLSFGHPTYFSCPEPKQIYAEQARFFVIEGRSK